MQPSDLLPPSAQPASGHRQFSVHPSQAPSSGRSASASNPNFHLYLYRKALHPELFPIKARRTVAAPAASPAMELEAWVLPGGHVIRFKTGAFACCELFTQHDSSLPMDGAVTGFPCTSEHDFEHTFGPERVKYILSAQTETLSDNLYRATYSDMLDLAKDTGAVLHEWVDDRGRKCLSMLELQRLTKEFHAQSYHLWAGTGLVVRTQTIFEVLNKG